MNKKQTHCKRILAYLDIHQSITPMEAVEHLHCLRLAARIADLEKAGHVFEHEMIYTRDQDGNPTKYMRYKRVA
jgi:hypothetical protein